MSEHTEEPWIWGAEHGDAQYEHRRILGNAHSRAVLIHAAHWPVEKADAHRIVACVNALEGIEDPSTVLQDMIDCQSRVVALLEPARAFLASETEGNRLKLAGAINREDGVT